MRWFRNLVSLRGNNHLPHCHRKGTTSLRQFDGGGELGPPRRLAKAVRHRAAFTRGRYRGDFLAAIDACLTVRYADRPQSVAQLRQILLGAKSHPNWAERLLTSVRAPINLPRLRHPADGEELAVVAAPVAQAAAHAFVSALRGRWVNRGP